MTKPHICIYTIMRNEDRNILQWLETAADADALVVVDTGSTDGTFEMAHLGGAYVFQVSIEPFRFDDARNAALALCPPKADLCFQVDADEILCDDWRQRIEDVWHPNIGRYRYRWENHSTSGSWGLVMRSNLHARHGFRWRCPIHEYLQGPQPTVTVPGLVVEHHPDVRKSRAHYLDLLAQAVAEEPDNHRMAFYFGRELIYQGKWANARRQLLYYLGIPNGWDAERSEAYRLIASIDDYPETWLWKAIGECPERREPWVDLARFYLSQRRPDAARAMITIAESRDDETVYITQRDAWGEPYEQLRRTVETAT